MKRSMGPPASRSMAPPASSSSQSWNHDVFLSFRGEDTRKTFVDHLYSALVQQGIHTYKDDETLARGESIGPALLKAIEESRIAIIVFSKNYTGSSWCLDELVFIMKCKDEKGLIVIPIFYDVEPSEIRKQKRKHEETFAKHDSVDTKVESWRRALVDAANLSGWEPKRVANGHESKCIKEIVDTIQRNLVPFMSSANKELIGIATRIKDLKSRLEVGLGDVRMVGIWGIGGGGKSTLAFSIYKEIGHHFDGCCFLENVREETIKHGLKSLQRTIMSHVLKSKQDEVKSIEEGKGMIRSRLCRRCVLIVLDDVDHLDHLKALAGSHDWFGKGSRIIITTRDEHLLNAHKVNDIYSVSLLNKGEAVELFCRHAFGACRPIEGYEKLSLKMVSKVGGLPLALKVLGSFLCDKDMSEWVCTLARLEDIPEIEIYEKLKISYDGLKSEEKEIFLDIACFFRGKSKDKAMEILDACGFHSIIGVKVLVQKALISISHEKFDMHDLVQEMGHYIVRGNHPNNPEKHSRVWRKKDVLDICDVDAAMENEKIEALRMERFMFGTPPQCLPHIVANMKKLRLISWNCYPASSFPTNFHPTKLCCLILKRGLQKQLWNGYKHLPCLKVINLSFSRKLIMTLDFDGVPNLERLMLRFCESLEEIHPSIGHLKKLIYLNLEACYSLKMFPPVIHLNKVETLVFSKCYKLRRFPDIQHRMDSLKHLHLDGSGIEVVPLSIGKKCPNLVSLDLGFCKNLLVNTKHKNLSGEFVDLECCLEDHSIPNRSMSHIGLQFLHINLLKLNLTGSNLEDGEIGFVAWELPNLQELYLCRNNFSRLNFSLLKLPRLKLLDVSDCTSLIELSELPSSIAVLRAEGCNSLERTGDISKCKWLWKASLFSYKDQTLFSRELLYNMHQGNAIEDHFMSLTLLGLEHYKDFVPLPVRGKRFTLQLPRNWYNDFSGFLISTVSDIEDSHIKIVIKQEIRMSSQSKCWQGFNERPKPTKINVVEATHIGYISFSSLRHTTWWNSAYNRILFCLDGIIEEIGFGVRLIPRMNKDNLLQTTKVAIDCSEFWDDRRDDGNTFMIQHDSKSSVEILWHPRCKEYALVKPKKLKDRSFRSLRNRNKRFGFGLGVNPNLEEPK